MNKEVKGFLVFFALMVVGYLFVIRLTSKNQNEFWKNHNSLSNYDSLDMEVNSLYIHAGAISFGTNISTNVGQFDYKALNGVVFDWDNFQPPFRLIKVKGNDTIRIVKGPKEYLFKFWESK